jgi:D-tyrosyl-tRNA(Tyr) deacylase
MGTVVGSAERGILIYLGVAQGDQPEDAEYMAEKIAGLRIFDDADGKMNLSVTDIKGQALVISQFTLMADARKGRRPSYSGAAAPDTAKSLYELFAESLSRTGVPTAKGVFQASMRVAYVNEGPVTILLDSRKEF